MAHAGGILEMFEMISLALKAAAPGSFRQMMGFIHNDGEGFALGQRCFHRFSQFSGSYPCRLSIHKRITQGTQDRSVILSPVETVGARSCGKDTGKGDETGIG